MERTSKEGNGRTTAAPDVQMRNEAQHVGLEVAKKLLSPEDVVDAAADASSKSVQGLAWHDSTYASGFAGLALLHQHASKVHSSGEGSEAKYRAAWQQSLQRAALATQQTPLETISIFSGAAGLANALAVASIDEPRYLAASARLDRDLAGLLDSYRAPTFDRGSRFDEYDIISGPSGTLLYSATRVGESLDLTSVSVKLEEQMLALALSLSDESSDRLVLYPESYPLPFYEDLFPRGYVNLGLSHGIPGLLLALAGIPGELTSDRRLAIETLVARIQDARLPGGWGQGYVPESISGAPHTPHQHDGATCSNQHDLPMFGWCYGTPGVCLAIAKAASRIGSDVLAKSADDSFEQALSAFLATPGRKISPTLCHGLSGIVLITSELARRGHEPSVEALPSLTSDLLNMYDAANRFGFRDQETAENFLDDPGILTGAAGVALTLLTLAARPAPGTWTPILGAG